MAGEFGAFINAKRKGRGPGGTDILLRDLAEAMGNMSVSYLSDIIKGRRNPPEKKLLDIIAENLGRQLGWQSEDVVDFADTLQAIADATAKDLQN